MISINASDWATQLKLTADKYHTIGCWVAISLNPVWAISDYYTLPGHWRTFFSIRLIVSILTLLALLLRAPLRLTSEKLIFIPALGISLQNAYMYSVMGPVDIQKHTFAYVALFIGVGMLVLWKSSYSIVLVVGSILANILFFYHFSALSPSEVLVNGGLLTATVAVFTILLIQTRYSLTKKEIMARLALAESNQALQLQKAIIEDKNKSITQSIHYAKRIQQAILPLKTTIKPYLPEHFVLYRPKDIVSGDFYWFSQRNGISVIAAADCTGHGVPGAFMSMIGNALLNEIVNEKGITQPAAILDRLRKGVMAALRQNGEEEEAKDGMDIAVCAIDFDKMSLQYAGAFNPLYLVRNETLIEIKADKQPIGIHARKQGAPFTNHQLPLQEGDTVYIFTDGFADQFGGPEDKKFRYKPFQELLLSLQSESMASQQVLLEQAFQDWKGTQKQTDDVLVVGIRISRIKLVEPVGAVIATTEAD